MSEARSRERLVWVGSLAVVLSLGCAGLDDDGGPPEEQPTPEPQECDEGELWDATLAACVPEACGAARYPAAPDPEMAAVYVDAGFEGGSNGTAENPYTSLSEGLWNAGPETAVLVAAGDYEVEGLQDLSRPGMALVGRCPELTTVQAADGGRVLRIGQTERALVEGLAFLGDGGEPGEDDAVPEPLVELFNSTELTIRRCAFRDGRYDGLLVWQCGQVEIADNAVSGCARAGISAALSTDVVARGNRVEGTRAMATGSMGHGLYVLHATGATVEDNVLADNEGGGVWISDGEPVAVHDNTARDNAGPGIDVRYCAGLTVEDNVAEGNRRFGLAVRSSAGTVTGNEVAGTTAGADGAYGWGLYLGDVAGVEVRDNTIEDSVEAGLVVAYATGAVEDNEVRSVAPNAGGTLGRGIELADVDDLVLAGNRVEDAAEIGIAVLDSIVEVRDNEVHATQPVAAGDDGYTFGHGIHVQDSTDVLCEGNAVTEATHHGIVYLDTLRGEVAGNVVNGTLAGGAPGWPHGDGIAVLTVDESVWVHDNAVADNERCGVLVDHATASVTGNTVTGNELAVVAQNQAQLTAEDNEIEGNAQDEVVEYPGAQLPVHAGGVEPLDGPSPSGD